MWSFFYRCCISVLYTWCSLLIVLVAHISFQLFQGAGTAIRPHLPDLVCCMLECLSSLEDQRLNYVEVSPCSIYNLSCVIFFFLFYFILFDDEWQSMHMISCGLTINYYIIFATFLLYTIFIVFLCKTVACGKCRNSDRKTWKSANSSRERFANVGNPWSVS